MPVLTLAQAINQALREELARDDKVILLGQDIGVYGGLFGVTKGLWEEFGAERVRDTPISESGEAGIAVGMALAGYRPVLEIMFADFVTVAFDHIVNSAAKMRFASGGTATVPLVVRLPYGASIAGEGYMAGGGPWHTQSNEAWFTSTAGLKVVMPSGPYDAKGLLKAAIRDDNPVVYYEQKGMYHRISEEVPEDEYIIPLGKAAVKRVGRDVTVIATGLMVHQALSAAERLADEGISVEVIDPRTLLPLDKPTLIESVQKTGRVVIAHEAPLTGGVGGEIAAVLADEAFRYLKAPVKRVAALDAPVPASAGMKRAFFPTAMDIMMAVRQVVADS